MRRHVFISYCSADRAAAEHWCRAIEAEGLACWMAPRDILPSADWAEQIIDGIDAAWALLLLLTKSSNASQQVRREVERAVHKRVAVLPLRTEDVTLSKSLEYFLSAQHWLDAVEGPPERHRAQVVRALQTLRDEAALAPKASQPAGAAASRVPAAATPQRNWDEAALAPFVRRLALHVGPVASLLVQRAALEAHDELALVALLAREIDDMATRDRFVAASLIG